MMPVYYRGKAVGVLKQKVSTLGGRFVLTIREPRRVWSPLLDDGDPCPAPATKQYELPFVRRSLKLTHEALENYGPLTTSPSSAWRKDPEEVRCILRSLAKLKGDIMPDNAQIVRRFDFDGYTAEWIGLEVDDESYEAIFDLPYFDPV